MGQGQNVPPPPYAHINIVARRVHRGGVYIEMIADVLQATA
jgi:hypothetical protein